MPTYKYKCNECEKIHEIFHSIHDDEPRICCTTEMIRLISGGIGYLLKGDGFYQTDYARKREGKKDA